MMIISELIILFLLIITIVRSQDEIINNNIIDIYAPSSCDRIASYGDHILYHYTIVLNNGTILYNNDNNGKSSYIQLNSNDNLIHINLKGVCKNTTRKISFDNLDGISLQPLYDNNQYKQNSISIIVKINHITSADDYSIFSYIKGNDQSNVIDMIDRLPSSVNAVDENEYSPLMAAIALKNFPIVATLLNARRPTVDVNHKKWSGHNAIFYSLDNPNAAILQALLRRGADPNGVLTTDDSMGNTALHLACYLEKEKHADLLLQYGANPIAPNKFGIKPIDLLPRDSTPSNKISFKRMFQDAIERWNKEEKTLVVEGEERKLPTFRQDL